MLLVAATAVGIVGTRNCDAQMRATQIDRRHPASAIALASPILMAGAIALLASRLLPPRPPRGEIFRQPGFTANWVALLVATMNVIGMFSLNPDRLSSLDEFIKMFDYGFFWPSSGQTGGGVLIAWITLASAGCWKAEPSWIDRSGRLLGVVWITAFVANRFAWLW